MIIDPFRDNANDHSHRIEDSDADKGSWDRSSSEHLRAQTVSSPYETNRTAWQTNVPAHAGEMNLVHTAETLSVLKPWDDATW